MLFLLAQEVAQRVQAYHAILHFGKSQAKSGPFTTFDELLIFLHTQWPGLKAKHNLSVGHKAMKDVKVINDETLRELFRRLGSALQDVHLYVDINSYGFSWYAKHPDAALECVKSSEVKQSTFNQDHTIADAAYAAAVDFVCPELLRRARVLDLVQSSEYTMRELISPILVGALCLVDDHNNNDDETKVRLICEKLISGTSGHGPVDYVLSYMNVYIVIGEAKHKQILEGLYQNLVQQRSALDSLADKMVGSAVVGCKRSRDFSQALNNLRDLITCGIISTGTEWMFSKTVRDPVNSSKVIAHKSGCYPLSLSPLATDPAHIAVLKVEVEVLLRMIVSMILTQKEAVDNHTGLKEVTMQTRLDAEESTMQAVARAVLDVVDEVPLEGVDEELE
jgi:hypothetical protein